MLSFLVVLATEGSTGFDIDAGSLLRRLLKGLSFNILVMRCFGEASNESCFEILSIEVLFSSLPVFLKEEVARLYLVSPKFFVVIVALKISLFPSGVLSKSCPI
jgi:hypothetical protein